MAYRVINVGTGSVGSHALRGIIEHPELELVGLVVPGPGSEIKAGKDAGELCGLDPIGVRATHEFDDAIAIPADVVAYFGAGFFRVPEVLDEFCRILESGKNIVSTSLSMLIDPESAPQDIRARIEQACRRGGNPRGNALRNRGPGRRQAESGGGACDPHPGRPGP